MRPIYQPQKALPGTNTTRNSWRRSFYSALKVEETVFETEISTRCIKLPTIASWKDQRKYFWNLCDYFRIFFFEPMAATTQNYRRFECTCLHITYNNLGEVKVRVHTPGQKRFDDALPLPMAWIALIVKKYLKLLQLPKDVEWQHNYSAQR